MPRSRLERVSDVAQVIIALGTIGALLFLIVSTITAKRQFEQSKKEFLAQQVLLIGELGSCSNFSEDSISTIHLEDTRGIVTFWKALCEPRLTAYELLLGDVLSQEIGDNTLLNVAAAEELTVHLEDGFLRQLAEATRVLLRERQAMVMEDRCRARATLISTYLLAHPLDGDRTPPEEKRTCPTVEAGIGGYGSVPATVLGQAWEDELREHCARDEEHDSKHKARFFKWVADLDSLASTTTCKTLAASDLY